MLTLICGIHNSGKTTYSARFDTVAHLDELGSYDAVHEAVRGIGNDVAVEGLYPRRKQRTQLLDACADHHPKRCIWLDTPLDDCLRRETRNRPPFVIAHCAHAFEPPTYDEGWDEIVRITC